MSRMDDMEYLVSLKERTSKRLRAARAQYEETGKGRYALAVTVLTVGLETTESAIEALSHNKPFPWLVI